MLPLLGLLISKIVQEIASANEGLRTLYTWLIDGTVYLLSHCPVPASLLKGYAESFQMSITGKTRWKLFLNDVMIMLGKGKVPKSSLYGSQGEFFYKMLYNGWYNMSKIMLKPTQALTHILLELPCIYHVIGHLLAWELYWRDKPEAFLWSHYPHRGISRKFTCQKSLSNNWKQVPAHAQWIYFKIRHLYHVLN